MTAYDTWATNLSEELDFWRRWLTEDEFRSAREPRLQPRRPLPNWIRDHIDSPAGSTVDILDVGSGPLSTVGTEWDGRTVRLVATDPLAAEYNALLAECGLAERADLIAARGENLGEVFADESFDFVHSANALDHAYDPLLCLQNMLHLCRPGAWVGVISIENEGERQRYGGLHQWNFAVDGQRLRLWNRDQDFFVDERLTGLDRLDVKPVDHGIGAPMFQATLRRRT